MQTTIRLAHPSAASRYPLAIQGSINWRRAEQTSAGDIARWQIDVALPELPAKHILIPSYASTAGAYQYQFVLFKSASEPSAVDSTSAVTGQTSTLYPVPDYQRTLAVWPDAQHNLSTMSSHIDCWHSEEDSRGLVVRLIVACEQPPTADLLTICVRELVLATNSTDSSVDEQLAPLQAHSRLSKTPALAPFPLSQMTAASDIAQRICSPTALAMAMGCLRSDVSWQHTIEACFDRHTKAYGKWPLAIYAASQLGILAATETFTDWSKPGYLLAQGHPIVCSIRFEKDQLENAPLERTGGHLVLLYGIDFTGDAPIALVMDPAGSSPEEVPRRYALEQFTAAWLQHRGASYVLSRMLA